MSWSGSFSNPHGGSLQHLLLLLSLLARLLGLERLLIRVELGLVPDKDLVLLSRRIDVVQFPLVLHRRDPVYGQQAYLLLLLRGGDRLGLKARLREQHLFLRRGSGGGCRGAGASCDKDQGCDGTENTC